VSTVSIKFSSPSTHPRAVAQQGLENAPASGGSVSTHTLILLREHRDMFDLVISDIHMPDMDG
jgi:CheY-like chemotaxis protein